MKSARATITIGAILLVVFVGVGSALVLDVDGDGVPAYEELGKSDPLSADTDVDGLDDGKELEFGSDPTKADTDADGLEDRRELEFGSDPAKADADGDGLTDAEEYWGTEGSSLGAEERNSDGDGAGDGGGGDGGVSSGTGSNAPDEFDVEWKRSDPTDPDTDGDGIEDGTEGEAGMDPTATDSDGDGLSDVRELDGPTDPADPDTDGDNLLDGWEVRGETPGGADIAETDPLHKDAFVHVLYLRSADEEVSSSVFMQVERWFERMPVQNPDGKTGIDVRFTGEQHTDRSIDEWVYDSGGTTDGVSGFMAMREFYNRETIGEKTGSHFLVVIPGDDVPVRGGGNAGGTKVSIIRPWQDGGSSTERAYARTILHEMLHNMVRKVGGQDCNGRMHTCEGFLSYTGDTYLSDQAKEELNQEGFAPVQYPEQMNATACGETMVYEDQCGA